MAKKIVFFTGAGISKESGMPTFRGEGGIWNEIDAEKVATARSWYGRHRKDFRERRQAMLDFFNPMRRAVMAHDPNEAHRIIARLEEFCQVTVITQNGDDFHSRAGSTDVIYLHGEAMKNASSANPYLPLPVDRDNPDIRLGDKAPDGSQIRPFVIYFDENIDRRIWNRSVRATKEADFFVVVGSSMLVFPAADLLRKINSGCTLVVIDPSEIVLPEGCFHSYTHIRKTASVGMKDFAEQLVSGM